MGTGVGPGRGRGAHRRHRRDCPRGLPAAPSDHRAACGKPCQRRHRTGRLRPGGRYHRRRGTPGTAARRSAVPAGLRRRGRGRGGGRLGQHEPAAPTGRPPARQPGHDPRSVHGVPAGRVDPRLRRPRGRRERPDHGPGGAQPHPRRSPSSGTGLLAAGHLHHQRRAVRPGRSGTAVRAAPPEPIRPQIGPHRDRGRQRGPGRGPVRLPVLLRLPDPRDRPAPRAAPEENERPGTSGQRAGGFPGRGVTGRGTVRAAEHRLGRAVPRPRVHRLRHLRRHRGDPRRAGPAAAGRGALGPAAPRHLRRRGAGPRRDHGDRGGHQGAAAARRRTGDHSEGRGVAAPGVRGQPGDRTGEGRRRRRRSGPAPQPPLHRPTPRPHRHKARHRRPSEGRAQIDDTVLRRLQAALDNEEVRLAGGEQVE